MRVKSISVENFRCHETKTVKILPDTTILIGKNGVGKTSLLEAVYIALRGSSFKGVDSEILKKGSKWYKIIINFDSGEERIVTFDTTKPGLKKQFVVHDKKSARLKATNKYPVVLFEPEDLRLLTGSPSRRRKFIDNFIAQIDPTYTTLLRKYEKVIKQRNALLKDPRSKPNDFFAWDISLSEYGSYIVERRIKASALINDSIESNYQNISRTKDLISVKYSAPHQSPQDILDELESSFLKDRALQYTSSGQHRHDVVFNFNESLASSNASRGETRSILLALKRVEIDQIYRITGKKPVVLLDDVFSELDEIRQNSLITFLDGCQTIITSTGLDEDVRDYLDGSSVDISILDISR